MTAACRIYPAFAALLQPFSHLCAAVQSLTYSFVTRFAMSRPSAFRLLLPLVMALTLSACEQLGIETPAQTTARQESEGKAVGGACRHAGRALEDCYKSSPKTSKAAIYAGWRDMDAYMRENKIDIVQTREASDRSEAKLRGGDAETPVEAVPESEERPAAKGKQS